MDANVTVLVPWIAIETVLLDMDGVLLDLRFDNYFWNELVPSRYASVRGLDEAEAIRRLKPVFDSRRGTLEWYCLDFWSDELGLDLAAMKQEIREQVSLLPEADRFLDAVRARGKRLVLVTNAHRDALTIKAGHTGLTSRFDAVYSAHDFGLPKEDLTFWEALRVEEPFEPARSLLIDDSLPVLEAASSFGIAHLVAVCRPDSSRAARKIAAFPAVHSLEELLNEEARTD